VKNRFYQAMLISRDPSQLIRLSAIEVKQRNGDADIRLNQPNIGIEAWRRESPKLDPGQSSTDRYALYVGPTNEEQLQQAEDALKPRSSSACRPRCSITK